MKKFIAIILCTVVLMGAASFATFAEDSTFDSAEQSEPVTENLPTSEEIVTEGEIGGIVTAPEGDIILPETEAIVPKTEVAAPVTEAIPGTSTPAPEKTTTEAIVAYIKAHLEEISVIVTLLLTIFYNARKHKLLNRSISATNHNAITVSENSDRTISEALERMQGISADVLGYKEAFAKLFEEYRASAEEKRNLEKTLNDAMTYIKSSKLANMEFANELAELLVLANIPNSKKDELYARHIAAVKSISETEENVTLTEVIADDIGKTE